jgi:hypothetical protein
MNILTRPIVPLSEMVVLFYPLFVLVFCSELSTELLQWKIALIKRRKKARKLRKVYGHRWGEGQSNEQRGRSAP